MRTLIPLTLAAMLTLVLALPAAAGGWATVALDHVPTALRAGTTHKLGYTTLQHGMTPFTGSRSVIRARSARGQMLIFPARPDGAPGHYVAEVTFPAAGTWTWEVVPEPFAPQPLAPITVTGPSTPASIGASIPAPLAGGSLPLNILRGALALATVFAGASFALHLTHTRRTAAATR